MRKTMMTLDGVGVEEAPLSPTMSTMPSLKLEGSSSTGGQNPAATAAAAAALAAPIVPGPIPKLKSKKNGPKKKKAVKYCKAPQAPKRFKSAFIFFTMARHKEIRKKIEEKEGKGDRTPDVAKIISEEWRSMKPDERAIWDEKARLDKERYEVEKSMYTGPWKIPAKQKTQKTAGAPKRPMSSFLSYSNSKRSELKKTHPGISNADASKLLARMWKEAPEGEKKEHIEREERLRQVYKAEIAQWRDKNKKEQEEVREKREEAALRYIDNRAKGIVDESDLAGPSWGEHYQYHSGPYEGGPPYGDPHYPPPPPYHGHHPHGYHPSHHDHRHGPPPPPPPPPHYRGPPPPPHYSYSHHGPPPPPPLPHHHYHEDGRDAPPPPPPGHYGHYDDGYGYGPPPLGPGYHHPEDEHKQEGKSRDEHHRPSYLSENQRDRRHDGSSDSMDNIDARDGGYYSYHRSHHHHHHPLPPLFGGSFDEKSTQDAAPVF